MKFVLLHDLPGQLVKSVQRFVEQTESHDPSERFARTKRAELNPHVKVGSTARRTCCTAAALHPSDTARKSPPNVFTFFL